MFRRIGVLETQTAVQENKLDNIMTKLDTIAEKLETLEAKPAKRWDGLVDKLICAAAGAFIAWLAAGMPV